MHHETTLHGIRFRGVWVNNTCHWYCDDLVMDPFRVDDRTPLSLRSFRAGILAGRLIQIKGFEFLDAEETANEIFAALRLYESLLS